MNFSDWPCTTCGHGIRHHVIPGSQSYCIARGCDCATYTEAASTTPSP